MPTKVQLSGGSFQDSEGNLLANGYLKMVLNQDETISGVGNICSGIEITIQLNSSGSVSTSPAQSVWGNDVMVPANSFYKVTGYTAAGQPSWGPNVQQVTGSGPFDVGTWIPNQVISWTAPNLPLTLKNNGTLNLSQQVLNVESSDASVTITDLGAGTINFQVAGASVPPGLNVIDLPPLSTTFPVATSLSTGNSTGATKSFVQYIPGTDLHVLPTHWTVSIRTVSGSTTVTAVMAKCALGSNVVLSTIPILFGGLSSPTLTPAGVYTSDSIALTLDTNHDYFLILNSSTGLMGMQEAASGQSGLVAGVYIEPSDFTATSPLTFSGGSQEAGKALTVQFLSA